MGGYLLNCIVTTERISLFFRCSHKSTVAQKLDLMVVLIQQHKELESELDKAIAFLASKMQVSEQEIHKEIWLRWPRVL